MASITWAHSGWDQLASGSQAQRDELSLHIKEVTELQAKGSYTVDGKAHAIELSSYIRELMRAQAALNAAPVTPAADDGERTYFTRGEAPPL